MKKLLYLILFIPFCSFGQIFTFENNNLELEISNLTISGQIDGLEFNGKLIEQKVNREKYFFLENESGTLAIKNFMLPSKYDTKMTLKNLMVTTATLKDLTKAIEKDRWKKINVLRSGAVVAINKKKFLEKKEREQELERKRLASQKQLDENIKKYGGTYKVKIYSTSGVNLKNQYGTLYITEQGFTLKTKVTSIERVSGSFGIPISNKVEEGVFSGNLGKGTLVYDNFTLSINKDLTAAGLTLATDSYSVSTTTTIIIEEKMLD